jgi:predicted MFS family arabinose efflux permease
MSTLTQAEFAGRTLDHASKPRIITGRLALVFLASFGTLTSFYLMLSVTPMYAASAGAGGTGAGLVTGVLLLAGVAAEFAAAGLIRRYGSRPVFALGAVLLGAPALALLASGSLVTIVAVSVVRGLGFGLTAVVIGALVAQLAPPGRRGEALGLSGVVACVPAVVALPSGVWLAGHTGFAVVIGLTAAAALVPLAAMPWLPGAADRRQPTAAGSAEQPAGLLAALRRGELRRPALIFAATTVSAGTVVAFLPLAVGVSGNAAATGLFVQAMTSTIGRWLAGRHGDRHGHARLLIPGLVLAAAGMTVMIWVASPAAVMAGMVLFGTGFGISQNATFALMIDRVPASAYGMASALWNLAYDAGYGAGPAALGVLVVHTGYPAVFALTAVLMLTALLPAWRDRSVDRHGPR